VQAKHPAVIVAVVLVLAALAAQFVVPLLDSDQAKLERFAAERVEKARRLLQAYQYNYPTLAASRARLSSAGLDLPAPSGQVAKAFSRNDSVLAEAAKLLSEAVSHQVGSARGSDLVEPNYLLGMVLYHQAVNGQLEAQTQRARARQARWQTLKAIASARDVQTEAKAAVLADLDPAIQRIGDEIAQVQTKAGEARSEAESLQRQVDELQARIAPLRQTAEQARRSLAVLKLDAPDADDLAAAEQYRRQWADLAKTEREADYQADALEYGWLPGAVLDPNAGADPLLAAYVGGQREDGVVALQQQLATSQARAEGYAAAVSDLQQQLDQLQQRDATRVRRAEETQTAAAARVAEVKQSLDEASRIAAEAETTESKALDKIEQARRSLTAALRAAGTRTQSARPPAGKRNERLEMIAADRSWDAETHSLLAETFIRQAEIHLQRVNDLADQKSTLQETVLLLGGEQMAAPAPPTDDEPAAEAPASGGSLIGRALSSLADLAGTPTAEQPTTETTGEATAQPEDRETAVAPVSTPSRRPARATELDDALEAVKVKIAEGRDAGLASIDRPDSEDDAIGHLDKAKRAEDSKWAWVIDARAGAVWYLLAQLTDDPQLRRQATDNAVAVLEEALKTSGGQPRGGPYVEPFSELLGYLQPKRTP